MLVMFLFFSNFFNILTYIKAVDSWQTFARVGARCSSKQIQLSFHNTSKVTSNKFLIYFFFYTVSTSTVDLTENLCTAFSSLFHFWSKKNRLESNFLLTSWSANAITKSDQKCQKFLLILNHIFSSFIMVLIFVLKFVCLVSFIQLFMLHTLQKSSYFPTVNYNFSYEPTQSNSI